MPSPARLCTAALALAACFVAAQAQAAPNLVVNGGFETTTNGTGEIVPGQTTGQYITSATGWYSTSTTANGGDPFLFIANNAVTAGFGDKWDNGIRYLWGASNGGASTWDGTSASGGNYLVMDGDYHATPISQMLSGLVTGQTYALSYSWAAAQFYNNTGATTETLSATLGSATQSGPTYSLPSNGFSGWMTQTMNFTYDGTSNVLSFLASGTPAGAPPMVLLDNVSLSAVPEPGTVALLAGSLVLVAIAVRRRTGTR